MAASAVALSSTHMTAARYPPSYTFVPNPLINTGWFQCLMCKLWMRAGTPHHCPMLGVFRPPPSTCLHGIPFNFSCLNCRRVVR